MASYSTRANGKVRAQVRVQGFKDQCKTFNTLAQAKRWAEPLEVSMKAGTVDLGE